MLALTAGDAKSRQLPCARKGMHGRRTGGSAPGQDGYGSVFRCDRHRCQHFRFYQFYKLRKLELMVRVFDAGTSFGVGIGTVIPARFSSESYSYGHRCLSRGAVDSQHRGLFQKFRRS
jgi:hypothetical protein